MKPLPIGIQNFRKLITSSCLYVDKTEMIYSLVRSSTPYFLSRPRRFGKSLLLSTMREIFLGNRELFKGLWINQSDYDWTPYPVLYLDFSSLRHANEYQLEASLSACLEEYAMQFDVVLSSMPQPAEKLKSLVKGIYRKTSQPIVILIDEYDYPILSHIHNVEAAKEIQKILKDFFITIKSLDEYLRFIFLTGVSKITNTSVFSGLNNLYDLSQDKSAATLLGYTNNELHHHFLPYFQLIATDSGQDIQELLAQARLWYNGYRFSSTEKTVYNPYSLLLYLQSTEFKNFWFRSGTPTFLINLLKMEQYKLSYIENHEMSSYALDAFELDQIPLLTLLYQTGYLTITDYNAKRNTYVLNYPNYEVKHSFLQSLMQACSEIAPNEMDSLILQLQETLQEGKVEEFLQQLKSIYAKLPYTIYLKYEKFYQSLFYLTLSLIGAKVYAEVATNQGRIDAVIETETSIYLFEFKVDSDGTTALQQIKERNYLQPYLLSPKQKILIGLSFDTQMHNIRGNWSIEIL